MMHIRNNILIFIHRTCSVVGEAEMGSTWASSTPALNTQLGHTLVVPAFLSCLLAQIDRI